MALGIKADGKWGPETKKAFKEAYTKLNDKIIAAQ